MNVFRILAIATALASCSALCSAQFTKKAIAQVSDYNLIQGRKALQAGDDKSARNYFEMAVNDDPSNGYAYVNMALCIKGDEPSRAVGLLRKALKVAKGDYYLIYKACSWILYLDPDCDDYESLLKQMSDACKHLDGSDAAYGQYALASRYYEDRFPQKAEAAMRESLRIWPVQSQAYSLGGEISMLRGDYEEAVARYETSQRMGYNARTDFYLQLARIANRDFRKAIDGLLDIIEDDGAYYKEARRSLFLGPTSALNPLFTSDDVRDFFILAEVLLRERMAKQPNVTAWPALLGDLDDSRGNYESAVRYYGMAEKNNSFYSILKAGSQVSMKDYGGAMSSISSYIGDYPSDPDAYSLRAVCREELGMPDDSVMSDLTKVVELSPGSDAFKRRAWFESMHGRVEDAILDYFEVLQNNPYDAYYLLQRGALFSIIGEDDLAKADLNAALRIAREEEKLDIQALAYARLGMAEEAEKAMLEKVRKEEASFEGDVDGAYYNLACVYSVLNKPQSSLDALWHAFQYGYDDFNHARTDFDLELVRRNAGFEPLVSEFEGKRVRALAAVAAKKSAAAERRVIIVPFEKKGGVISVRCVVNGLPLSFIFDSGASDVSISRVEANFMLANGYIKESDFGDRAYYTVADGSVRAGTKVKLSSVTLGGETIHDVWASVVDGQNSPLLLGQTVMSRLGKVEIDYENKVVMFYR